MNMEFQAFLDTLNQELVDYRKALDELISGGLSQKSINLLTERIEKHIEFIEQMIETVKRADKELREQ